VKVWGVKPEEREGEVATEVGEEVMVSNRPKKLCSWYHITKEKERERTEKQKRNKELSISYTLQTKNTTSIQVTTLAKPCTHNWNEETQNFNSYLVGTPLILIHVTFKVEDDLYFDT